MRGREIIKDSREFLGGASLLEYREIGLQIFCLFLNSEQSFNYKTLTCLVY